MNILRGKKIIIYKNKIVVDFAPAADDDYDDGDYDDDNDDDDDDDDVGLQIIHNP